MLFLIDLFLLLISTHYSITPSVNGKLEKHSFGDKVDLSSYTSVSNAFICPSDGYICTECPVGTENQMYAMINDRISCVARSNGKLNGHAELYVKKGMTIYRSDGLTGNIWFTPII